MLWFYLTIAAIIITLIVILFVNKRIVAIHLSKGGSSEHHQRDAHKNIHNRYYNHSTAHGKRRLKDLFHNQYLRF